MTRTTRRTRPALVVLVTALIGAAVFLSLYGTQVLNPSYTDWLMDGGSLSKSYLGWRFYQSANWQIPLGNMDSLGYPQPLSVASTDSIPLLAIICKLLAPLHEGPFQYFGLWGLLCFVLQGVFGGLLCLGISRSPWQAILGGFFFVLSPVLWQGAFASGGLAGHWVVLAALLPLVHRRGLSARHSLPNVMWGALGGLAISIHSQFALVCGIFCVSYCLYAALATRQWRKSLPIAVFAMVVLVLGGVLGAFSGGGTSGVRPLGASPRALWDAHNYSRILRNFSNPGDYQYADFAYLGFGALLICAQAFAWLVRRFFKRANVLEGLKDGIRTRLPDLLAVGNIALCCAVLGLSQIIAYLVLTAAFFILTRRMNRRLVSAMLACCLCLQAYDASAVWLARRMHYRQTISHEPTTELEGWTALLQDDAWKTVVISPAVSQSVYLPSLAELISQGGQTLSTLSFTSAADYADWESTLDAPQDDMVFVFTASELLEMEHFSSVYRRIDYLYQLDDLIIGFSRPTLLPSPQILRMADIEFQYRYPIGQNAHLKSGEDVGGIRYIYAGGLSYGPYVRLDAGRYEVRVIGERLDEAGFRFTLASGDMTPTQTLLTPSEAIYRLDVSKAVTDLEILIENTTADTLYFSAMTITQLD